VEANEIATFLSQRWPRLRYRLVERPGGVTAMAR